ncbi:MAG: enoyl-CoA hydratase/isomerase family protein [Saprospiraceae bacterium]|nr:enoyl-CoA hydratase/isomerase family protein [Saprospiraceae bacterium]
MSDNVLNIKKEENYYILTINRPHALNALNHEVFTVLDQFFTQYYRDYSVKGIVITGSGDKAFVAGADIKEFSTLDAVSGAQLSKKGQDIFFKIERFHAPVIAAVNGFALGGGCELAMACHIRVAGTNARFGQPEVKLGLVPGYGGSQRLIQLIGKGKATELLLTTDMVNAHEALELGLVNYVVEPGNEVSNSLEILAKISEKGPLAVDKCIQLVNAYFDKGADGFKNEYTDFGELLGSQDAKEGALAFVEKRKPVFTAK